MKELFISLVQLDISTGDPRLNREKVKKMIEKAALSTPDMIVLPEMWNTGYSLKNLGEICDRDGHPSIDMVEDLARTHTTNIVAGSVSDMRKGKVYNTCYVVDRKGSRVGEYSKIHLFRLMGEDKHFTGGSTPGLFELEGVTCGVAICYDLRFPELIRGLALRGAKVVFIPAQWPHPRKEHWITLIRARAIENQVYIVGVNRVGKSGSSHFFGSSMVVNPWGEVVVQAGDKEGVINAKVDVKMVDEVRERIPVFRDRKPEVY